MAGGNGHTGDNRIGENLGRGFTLIAALIGLAGGAAIYGVGEYWLKDGPKPEAVLPVTVMAFVIHATLACLLLFSKAASLRSLAYGLAVALVLSIPVYFLVSESARTVWLSEFPIVFWSFPSAPITFFILTTFAKASLDDEGRPTYRTIFLHGLTLPLIAAGAVLIAGLAFLLLSAWAALLRSLDVDIFTRIFREAWFIARSLA